MQMQPYFFCRWVALQNSHEDQNVTIWKKITTPSVMPCFGQLRSLSFFLLVYWALVGGPLASTLGWCPLGRFSVIPPISNPKSLQNLEASKELENFLSDNGVADFEKIESRWHFWLFWNATQTLKVFRFPSSVRFVALDAYPPGNAWTAADAKELASWICAQVGPALHVLRQRKGLCGKIWQIVTKLTHRFWVNFWVCRRWNTGIQCFCCSAWLHCSSCIANLMWLMCFSCNCFLALFFLHSYTLMPLHCCVPCSIASLGACLLRCFSGIGALLLSLLLLGWCIADLE